MLNDAQVMRGGKLGINVAAVQQNNITNGFTGLNFGIFRGVELDVVVGILPNKTYVGLNTEISLTYEPNISISIGGHSIGGTGAADATFNVSFPMTRQITLYMGVDGDINFQEGTTTIPAWYFFGMSTFIFSNAELFIEADPPISKDASSIFAGGARIYF